MSSGNSAPVAVGGIGGSGTRVIAKILEMLGYYLGDDLNEALDNLWFTLLFKRRSVLLEDEQDIRELVLLFFSRMSGNTGLSDQQRILIARVAKQDRLQHSREWLAQRVDSFLSGHTSLLPGQPWCWKEPNTHIVVGHMLNLHPGLRYIHVLRHPLDTAFGPNQNQLDNWGPIFLDNNMAVEPRTSLSYWCAVHRRIMRLARHWPNRVSLIDFDRLCEKPDRHCLDLAKFLGIYLSATACSKICDFVRKPGSAGRFAHQDLAQLDSADLSYIRDLGYSLTA